MKAGLTKRVRTRGDTQRTARIFPGGPLDQPSLWLALCTESQALHGWLPSALLSDPATSCAARRSSMHRIALRTPALFPKPVVKNTLRIPIYQLDAFASAPFKGNPAAVCPLDA